MLLDLPPRKSATAVVPRAPALDASPASADEPGIGRWAPIAPAAALQLAITLRRSSSPGTTPASHRPCSRCFRRRSCPRCTAPFSEPGAAADARLPPRARACARARPAIVRADDTPVVVVVVVAEWFPPCFPLVSVPPALADEGSRPHFPAAIDIATTWADAACTATTDHAIRSGTRRNRSPQHRHHRHSFRYSAATAATPDDSDQARVAAKPAAFV